MAEIYNWIKNIVIYMILNTIIMNLLGNSSYKKYISIVSGMILVIIVVSPIMSLMKLDEKFDYFRISNEFSMETSDFKNELNQMEEGRVDAVFSEYEDKIKGQVEEMLSSEGLKLVSFHLTLDRDVGKTTYGEITGMNITATPAKGKEEADAVPSFGRIEIDKIEIGGQEEKAPQDLPSPAEIKIKNKLSDFYYIEPDNINISIQGG